ncbi:MAG: hypothetical protein ABW171_06570 [Steroidobacter sp.]
MAAAQGVCNEAMTLLVAPQALSVAGEARTSASTDEKFSSSGRSVPA